MKHKTIIGILLVFMMAGCLKDNEVVSVYNSEPFRKIEFDNSFEVRFHRSDSFRVVATGNEKFIEEMKYRFAGDSLVVKNDARATWLYPQDNKIVLDVYCDSLMQIRANETCNLTTVDTLYSANLFLIVGSKLNIANLKVNCEIFGYYNAFPCGGVMEFSGKTRQLNIWNDALMEVHAAHLTAQFAYIENLSGGSSRIRVEQGLEYKIRDRGDIFLSGNPPSITVLEDSGEGELILVD